MLYKELEHINVECQDLIRGYAPKYEMPQKRAAYEKALRLHESDCGDIQICQVGVDAEGLRTERLAKRTSAVTVDKGYFDYTKAKEGEETWFLNFADPYLFVAYDSELFAQDEIQCLEMPLLASCRLYLEEKGKDAMTSRFGVPTPFTFRSVPYWISVNTNPVLKDGSVGNIYGNNLYYASEEEVQAGIRTFEGNIRCNVIAMAAPACGYGQYSKAEIEEILKTLLCSYSALKDNCQEDRVVIHTGNWGCGAFGGNRELMYLSQIYAASVCGISEIVLHSPDGELLGRAKTVYDQIPSEMSFDQVVQFLLAKGYCWGLSDGN